LFTRATLETPQQTDGWRGLGLTLVKLGSYEEALESLDRALDLDIGIAECWYLKAQALSRLGDDNGAIQALRRAISLNDRSRQLARTESAFNPLRTNPTFQELIEE
jgi:tetratricopeptide (TPR) repeat protein